MQQIPNIKFTKEGYESTIKKRDRLLTERKEAVVNLRQAREMGDLSENGYYKAARARLSFIDSSLRHLNKLIRFGKIVQNKIHDKIDIGSTVTITDGINKFVYHIVGNFESDPKSGKISTFSPIGKSLTGRREGDQIVVDTPGGIKKYKIVNFSYE